MAQTSYKAVQTYMRNVQQNRTYMDDEELTVQYAVVQMIKVLDFSAEEFNRLDLNWLRLIAENRLDCPDPFHDTVHGIENAGVTTVEELQEFLQNESL